MLISDKWTDFEVIDAKNGEKLERWGKIILRRPDPQVIWDSGVNTDLWNRANGTYFRSVTGGGHWDNIKNLPERWAVKYNDLTFNIKTMGFKHTGLFPEQAVNWDYIINKIQTAKRPVRVLNLFAYTGGATLAAAYAGALETVHVDAAKGIISWAKENVVSSSLEKSLIRFIVDDAVKYVLREKRRGRQYDAIIMDPPSYGRGPSGEIWKIENEIFPLINACMDILSDNPLFFIINSYTTGLSPLVMSNILKLTLMKKYGGQCDSFEIGLPISNQGLVLPTGYTTRWEP